jgi:hypothetical protein
VLNSADSPLGARVRAGRAYAVREGQLSVLLRRKPQQLQRKLLRLVRPPHGRPKDLRDAPIAAKGCGDLRQRSQETARRPKYVHARLERTRIHHGSPPQARSDSTHRAFA